MDPKPPKRKPSSSSSEPAKKPRIKKIPSLYSAPPQFAMILAKRKALHGEFVESIKKNYRSIQWGFTVIGADAIQTCPGGKSYLIDEYVDEFGSLLKLLAQCRSRNPPSVVLYVLDTLTEKWNLNGFESNLFTVVITNEPERYANMDDFVQSLR